jgi:hypothetical protein
MEKPLDNTGGKVTMTMKFIGVTTGPLGAFFIGPAARVSPHLRPLQINNVEYWNAILISLTP